MLDGTREDENVPNELPEIARIQEQSYQGLDLDEELDEREEYYQEPVEKIELSLASKCVKLGLGRGRLRGMIGSNLGVRSRETCPKFRWGMPGTAFRAKRRSSPRRGDSAPPQNKYKRLKL